MNIFQRPCVKNLSAIANIHIEAGTNSIDQSECSPFIIACVAKDTNNGVNIY